MYCIQCGAQIDPKGKFCASCGKLVPQVPVNTIAPVLSNHSGSSEVVFFVLNAQRIESLFKRNACSVIFMKEKLIVAHLSAQRQKDENAKITSEIKAQGKGFFKGSAAMMQFWANYHAKYYSMTSEDIIAEDPMNFEINYSNIQKLSYRCESTDIDDEGRNYGHPGELDISLSVGKKVKFSHTHSHDNTTKKTLVELFGKKLKYS